MSDLGRAPDAPLDQVEWRVQGKIDRGGGVTVVAYLDGPTVSRLLDEWVGPARWFDRYELTGKPGSMWCHLSVKCDEEWVTKVDLGTASDMEADKGLVSDAFKRVAMRKWRVGANVFDLPILRITRFRQVDRPGKEPQAYLTDESQAEIRRQLQQAGFDDAAQAVKVAAASSSEPAPSSGGRAAGGQTQDSSTLEELRATIRRQVMAADLTDAFVAYLADVYGVNRLDELGEWALDGLRAVTVDDEAVEEIRRDYAPAEVAG